MFECVSLYTTVTLIILYYFPFCKIVIAIKGSINDLIFEMIVSMVP